MVIHVKLNLLLKFHQDLDTLDTLFKDQMHPEIATVLETQGSISDSPSCAPESQAFQGHANNFSSEVSFPDLSPFISISLCSEITLF